jgi:hypothetical protein
MQVVRDPEREDPSLVQKDRSDIADLLGVSCSTTSLE